MKFSLAFFTTSIIMGGALFAPLQVGAARIYIDRAPQSVQIGDEFLVHVVIDTQDEIINAVEGQVSYPKDVFKLLRVYENESQIALWNSAPTETQPGLLELSGITPGGIINEHAKIVTLVFSAVAEGVGTIATRNFIALIHDGSGTKAQVIEESVNISVASLRELQAAAYVPVTVDVDPPEPFVPYVATSSSLFEGKQFVVFEANDKLSGVSHYLVSEGGKDFIQATSPLLLSNQTEATHVIIKAVDKLGNERVAEIDTGIPVTKSHQKYLFAILYALVLLIITSSILWRLYTQKR